MKGFGTLLATEAKLYWRMPLNAFFTLALPLMMLLVFGSIFGNEPLPMYGGYGTVDRSVPAYAGMVIVMGAFISLPISLAGYREKGVLKRLRATPANPAMLLAAQLIVQLLVACGGFCLLFLGGKLIYGMRFEGDFFAALGTFAYAAAAFYAPGLVLAGILPNMRTVTVVGNIVVYPLIWFSGATVPLEVMPPAMTEVARFVPLSHAVQLLQGIWQGDTWAAHQTEVLVLGILLIAGVLVAVKTFRWE